MKVSRARLRTYRGLPGLVCGVGALLLVAHPDVFATTRWSQPVTESQAGPQSMTGSLI